MKTIVDNNDYPCLQGSTIYIKPDVTSLSNRKLERLKEIAMLQKFYQRNPIRFVEDFFNVQLLDYQKWVLQRSWTCPNVLLVCTRGWGKALDIDTPIMTPDGRKTIQDIQAGDYVFGSDGKPTLVIAESDIFYGKTYEITFSDGEVIKCHQNHIWRIFNSNTKQVEDHDSDWIFENYKRNGSNILSVPYSPALKFEKKELPIDPYILGVFLGDGVKSNGVITSSNQDANEMCDLIRERGYIIHSVKERDEKKYINVHLPDGTPLITELKKLKLNEEKYIPDVYLTSSFEDRLFLLQGLMDTDGCISKQSQCEFAQNNEIHARLAIGFEMLLNSLGIKHSVKYAKRNYRYKEEKLESTAVRFCFTADRKTPVFRMKRKLERAKDELPEICKKKFITNVRQIDPIPTKCIEVANPDHIFLCGNKNTPTHNSFIIDLLLMAKGMLFNNYWSYIASGSGAQAQQTFTTLERLANDNIDTMVGSTGCVFKNELVVPNASGDGFSHSVDGYRYTLHNNSQTVTLNSNTDAKRGFRGNVVFDETAWLSAEMLHTYSAFAVVNKEFKTGNDSSGKAFNTYRIKSLPKDLPNQLFYISSASSTDTEFYRLFRHFSKEMLLGNPNYFVAMMDCEVAFKPTINGEVVSALLSPDTVQNAMKTNPEKARREYYCEFTTDAGDNAVLKRGVITRNSETRKPLFYNDTGDKKFVICYDPARLSDNSIIGVAEIYHDFTGNLKARIVNCISLVDIHKKKRTPTTIQNQISILRNVILNYNEGGDENYSNILGVYIDAGAGGQASAIADLLMEDWKDKEGRTHKGLVDPDYDDGVGRNFPNAVKDKLRMMKPNEYKSVMYEAMIDMAQSNNIKFTADYDNKGYLSVIKKDDNKYIKERDRVLQELKANGVSDDLIEKQLEEVLKEQNTVSTERIVLDQDEELALSNIDLMKEQVVNMCRIKRETGRDGFELVPEKKNTMHDDAAYVLAMIGYALSLERKTKRLQTRTKKKVDIAELLGSATKKASFKRRF